MREPPETACVRASGAPGGPEARVAALLLHSGRSDAQPCVGALVHAPAAVRRMTRPSCQGLTPREVALLGPYAELLDVNAQFNDSLTTMSPAQVLASTIYLVDHLPYARVSLKFTQISFVNFAYFAPSFHANFMQNFFKSWVSIIGSKHESFVSLCGVVGR